MSDAENTMLAMLVIRDARIKDLEVENESLRPRKAHTDTQEMQMDASKVKRYVCTRVLLEDGETSKPTHFQVVALSDYDDAMMHIGKLETAIRSVIDDELDRVSIGVKQEPIEALGDLGK
jgi:hypothetical protein